jgi:hypothetical protein
MQKIVVPKHLWNKVKHKEAPIVTAALYMVVTMNGTTRYYQVGWNYDKTER